MLDRTLVRKLAHRFDLPFGPASFLALLIVHETVDHSLAYEELGVVDLRALAFRLRQQKKIKLNSRRFVGYWLDPNYRGQLEKEYT